MGKGSSRARRAILLIVALLLISGVVIVVLWWRGVLAEDARMARPVRSETPEVAMQPAGSSQGAQSQTALPEPPSVEAAKSDQAMRDVEKKAMSDRQLELYEKENDVYEKMPKYEDVREKMRKLAEERLSGVDVSDTQAVLALSDGELETFWEMGSLSEPDAYDHAYLACAIMERAASG
jgi:hypothetical protein